MPDLPRETLHQRYLRSLRGSDGQRVLIHSANGMIDQ
jgi:hypothetical protein